MRDEEESVVTMEEIAFYKETIRAENAEPGTMFIRRDECREAQTWFIVSNAKRQEGQKNLITYFKVSEGSDRGALYAVSYRDGETIFAVAFRPSVLVPAENTRSQKRHE